MRIGVAGLWHLGTVTAACMASAGHDVVAFDGEPETSARLEKGQLPVAEPGLEELIARAVAAGRLRFSSRPAATTRAMSMSCSKSLSVARQESNRAG